MLTVNIFKAKSDLSRLVEAVESGVESEIIIARNGKPAARLVPVAPRKTGPRVGVARADFDIPPTAPETDAAIASLFEGRPARRRPSRRRGRN